MAGEIENERPYLKFQGQRPVSLKLKVLPYVPAPKSVARALGPQDLGTHTVDPRPGAFLSPFSPNLFRVFLLRCTFSYTR